VWKGSVLAGVVAAQLSACALVDPEPARHLGILIENGTGRDVNFSIGAADDASAVGVVAACTAEVVPGVMVREGDAISLSDGGEVWHFDTLPSDDIGGLLVMIPEDGPPVVHIMDVNDRLPRGGNEELCRP
jgi:hypothetical protein